MWSKNGIVPPRPPRPPGRIRRRIIRGPIFVDINGDRAFWNGFDRRQTCSPPIEIADLHATCQHNSLFGGGKISMIFDAAPVIEIDDLGVADDSLFCAIEIEFPLRN